MIQIIKSRYPNFERMEKEDEENDTSKAWAVPGKLFFRHQMKIKIILIKCVQYFELLNYTF